MSLGFKKFLTVEEAREREDRLQKAWDAVRGPSDPTERPVDNDQRSLFERLQSNISKKEEEFEESMKFKNQIYKGLDEDEHEFMETLYHRQREIEAAREQEVQSHAEQFRIAVAANQTTPAAPEQSGLPLAAAPIVLLASCNRAPKKSQAALLSGAVKRKSTDGPEAKRPLPDTKVPAPLTSALVSAYSDDDDEDEEDKAGSPKLGLGLVGYGGDGDDDNSNND